MAIKSAKFLCSSEKLIQCPPAIIEGVEVVEVAFIGRSNVGKSSLINALTNNSALAKVSSRPGKTQLINHFQVDNNLMLVDLPGYGYAKTSKERRHTFSKLIDSYVMQRIELYCLFVLVDIRLEAQKIDIDFMRTCAENGVPFAVVFTKGDKLSAQARKKSVENYQKAFALEWEEFPPYFVTSATTRMGCDKLIAYVEVMIAENDENNRR